MLADGFGRLRSRVARAEPVTPPGSKPIPRAAAAVTALAAPAEVSDDDYDDGGEEAGRPTGSSLSRSSSFSDIGGESTDTEVCLWHTMGVFSGLGVSVAAQLRRQTGLSAAYQYLDPARFCNPTACRASSLRIHVFQLYSLLLIGFCDGWW